MVNPTTAIRYTPLHLRTYASRMFSSSPSSELPPTTTSRVLLPRRILGRGRERALSGRAVVSDVVDVPEAVGAAVPLVPLMRRRARRLLSR